MKPRRAARGPAPVSILRQIRADLIKAVSVAVPVGIALVAALLIARHALGMRA